MKKTFLPLILFLILLTGCTGVIQTGDQNLTIEQVQQFAQQTLTAQAGPSSSDGGLIIRPVSATPTAAASATGSNSGGGIYHPVYMPPTATPEPTATIPYITFPVYQQPTAAYSAPNYAQQVSTVCERIRFIDDITIPDNTALQPGQVFRKVWRIQNAGSCAWSAGYQLVYTGGDAMGTNYAVNLPGAVAPGQTVDVSIDLTAPNAYGSYQSFWKLRSPAGNIFGTSNSENDAIWVKIVVGNSSNLATVAPGVTPVNMGCTLLSVSPAYRASFKRGAETDFIFQIRNNTNTYWDTESFDIAYISGENMLKRKAQTRKDLPYDVGPGGTLKYALDAVVPSDPGVYTMTMGIVRGYEVLCSMDVTVTVVN